MRNTHMYIHKTYLVCRTNEPKMKEGVIEVKVIKRKQKKEEKKNAELVSSTIGMQLRRCNAALEKQKIEKKNSYLSISHLPHNVLMGPLLM